MASMCFQAGLDSLGSVELRSQVSERFGIALPATLAYDYPTVQALAEFITPQLGPATSHAPATFAVAIKSQRSLGLMHTDHSATSVVVRAVASQFPQAESGGDTCAFLRILLQACQSRPMKWKGTLPCA